MIMDMISKAKKFCHVPEEISLRLEGTAHDKRTCGLCLNFCTEGVFGKKNSFRKFPLPPLPNQ